MRRSVYAVALAVMCGLSAVSAFGQAQAPVQAPAAVQTARPERPIAEIKRVVIISVDGMRPDLMLRADTPNMHQLFENGSYSFWARTTEVSITLPSHVSMLTGVPPEKHGITWNGDEHNDASPKWPNILDLAHKAGYKTALVSGKSKFAVLANRGGVDFVAIPKAGSRSDDMSVAENAVAIIRDKKPDAMMIHFGDNDKVGHAIGWGTKEEIAALGTADKAIGEVLKVLRETGAINDTLIILSADHGGAGKTHGKDDPRSRHIPWIASGPKIRQGLDLTTDKNLVINTEDTFATAAYVLGLKPELPVDGKPVMRVFALDELITPAGK